MVSKETILQALTCMWEEDTSGGLHRYEDTSELYIYVQQDSLSAKDRIGDVDSRTSYLLNMSAEVLEGFRRAVAQCSELDDAEKYNPSLRQLVSTSEEEKTDHRLKWLIRQAEKRYNDGKNSRMLRMGLTIGAALLPTLLLAGLLKEATGMVVLAAGAVAGVLGWRSIFREWNGVKAFWEACDLSSADAVVDSLEKLQKYLLTGRK